MKRWPIRRKRKGETHERDREVGIVKDKNENDRIKKTWGLERRERDAVKG